MDIQVDNSNENVMKENDLPLDARKQHLIEAEKNEFNAKCDNLMAVFSDGVHETGVTKERSAIETNCDEAQKVDVAKVERFDNAESSSIGVEETASDVAPNGAEEIVERGDLNSTGESSKNEGIVIQIVKERGNLKMKQMPSKHKKLRSVSLKKNDLEDCSPKDSPDLQCEKNAAVLDSGENIHEHEHGGDSLEKLNGDLLFLCCICKEWQNTLKELLVHVKDDHTEIQIPREYELLLYKQRKAILNIEATAKELISMKKYKAVTRLLNSSKISLKSFNLDLFGSGDINIFEKLISVQFTRIKNSLAHHKQINETKKTLKNRTSKRKEHSTFEGGIHNRRKKKITRKVSKIHSESASSGFSSGDDICLKNIANDDVRRIKHDGEIVGSLDPDADEICLQFYAVPMKDDGGTLNTAEVDELRFVVKNIWNSDKMDLNAFAHVKIKRFEKEVDELLPDDTIFCGYLAKENKHLLNDVVALKDLFNEKCFLNDEIRTHKRREIEIKIDKDDGNVVVYEDEVKNLEVNGNYVKSDEHSDGDLAKFGESFDDDDDAEADGGSPFKGVEEAASSDNYDDGFNKETAYLAEHPQVLFRNKTQPYKGLCKICGHHFALRAEFQTHSDMHKNMFLLIGGDQFSCKMCGIRLSGSRLLVHYEKTHRFTIVCEVCCEHFTSFDQRTEHFKSHEALTCGICKEDFEDVFFLRDHFQDEHTGRRKFKFEVVPDEHANVESIDSSLPKKSVKFSKTSNKAPVCTICGRKFTSLGRLQQHNSIVHGGMSFRKNKNPAELLKSARPIGEDDVKYEVEID